MIPNSLKSKPSQAIIEFRNNGNYNFLRPMRYWAAIFMAIMPIYFSINSMAILTSSFSVLISNLMAFNFLNMVILTLSIAALYLTFLYVIFMANIFDLAIDLLEIHFNKYVK